jgi:hypothetical protein
LAVIEKDGATWLPYENSDEYPAHYDIKDHPGLGKINSMYAANTTKLHA